MDNNYMNTQATEGALGWNDEITKDDEFELLPAGVYDFKVESLERGYFDGSEKMSACPKADLTLIVHDPVTGKEGKIFESLFLHSKSEWRLSQFFTAIGQKKKGEPLRMDWNKVPGSSGRLELTVNEYTSKKDGSKRQNNRVGRYLPKEIKTFTPGQF